MEKFPQNFKKLFSGTMENICTFPPKHWEDFNQMVARLGESFYKTLKNISAGILENLFLQKPKKSSSRGSEEVSTKLYTKEFLA